MEKAIARFGFWADLGLRTQLAAALMESVRIDLRLATGSSEGLTRLAADAREAIGTLRTKADDAVLGAFPDVPDREAFAAFFGPDTCPPQVLQAVLALVREARPPAT